MSKTALTNGNELILTMPFQDKTAYKIGSQYGMRFHPVDRVWRFHNGVDIGAPEGTPLVPCAGGVVIYIGRDDTNGNFVRVKHDNGMVTGYAHMKDPSPCLVGDKVNALTVIGYVGSTGKSTCSHLHLTLWVSQELLGTINPELIL